MSRHEEIRLEAVRAFLLPLAGLEKAVQMTFSEVIGIGLDRALFGLIMVKDGSVTIVLSHDKPAKLGRKNWIAAPSGRFILVARFYAPTAAVLANEYQLPPVVKK